VIYWSQCIWRAHKCGYSVYWLLILRDQLVVCSLRLIYLVAASGHNYLALIRQGGLNPLTIGSLAIFFNVILL
jgi:hypothetical protein